MHLKKLFKIKESSKEKHKCKTLFLLLIDPKMGKVIKRIKIFEYSLR